MDDLQMVIVGGILNFIGDPSSASLSFLSVLREVFAVPFSVAASTGLLKPFFFDGHFFATSLDVSDKEASDASAASAAEARAPSGSFITSLGVMYIRS